MEQTALGTRGVVGFDRAALRALRLLAGLSQGELAGRARAHGSKLSPQHICLYETGGRVPRLTTLQSLAAALQVPPGELLRPSEPNELNVLRVRAGLSQRTLAALLGIAQARWSRIERGHSCLDASKITTAAGLLHVTIEQLHHALKTSRSRACQVRRRAAQP